VDPTQPSPTQPMGQPKPMDNSELCYRVSCVCVCVCVCHQSTRVRRGSAETVACTSPSCRRVRTSTRASATRRTSTPSPASTSRRPSSSTPASCRKVTVDERTTDRPSKSSSEYSRRNSASTVLCVRIRLGAVGNSEMKKKMAH